MCGDRGHPEEALPTDSDHDLRIAPNLLERRFDVDLPNRVWVADITFLPTDAGWVYLAVVIDLHSRKVVGWALDDHMRTSLVQEAMNMAVRLREPLPGLIHHSDRGVQYAIRRYQAALAELEATPSMSARATAGTTRSPSRSSGHSSRIW